MPLVAPPSSSTPAPPPAARANAGTNKEKTVRQWFVDHDLIESVPLPARKPVLQHPAPGIVLFLNKAKPKARKGKVFSSMPARSSRRATQELHPGRRHPAHRRHSHRWKERKNSAASSITPS
jgi:hypothetical protein